MSIQAVVFDLGGVVLESPLEFITEFEREHRLPLNVIARLVGGYGGTDGPWQRLERGEVPLSEFCNLFDEALLREGVALKSAAMMSAMSERSVVRDAMLRAIRRLRKAGLTVAALTNNWEMGEDHDARLEPLREEFDLFIESCKVKMRKPEPRIYELTLQRLGIAANAAVFLDDIGGNLKVARQIGMQTIKVVEPRSALAELERLVEIRLLD